MTIENAIIEEITINNNKAYKIYPKEGYKLHEKSRDEAIIDENGNETGKVKLGYTKLYIIIGAGYDFEVNERQIYTKPDSEEEEIAEADSVDSETEEKAKAYDILMGADE